MHAEDPTSPYRSVAADIAASPQPPSKSSQPPSKSSAPIKVCTAPSKRLAHSASLGLFAATPNQASEGTQHALYPHRRPDRMSERTMSCAQPPPAVE